MWPSELSGDDTLLYSSVVISLTLCLPLTLCLRGCYSQIRTANRLYPPLQSAGYSRFYVVLGRPGSPGKECERFRTLHPPRHHPRAEECRRSGEGVQQQRTRDSLRSHGGGIGSTLAAVGRRLSTSAADPVRPERPTRHAAATPEETPWWPRPLLQGCLRRQTRQRASGQ